MSAHVQEKLWAHARGQLPAGEARDVDAHLTECSDCSRVLAQFRGAVAFVKPVEPPPLDDATWRRIDERVMDAARRELRGSRHPFAWLMEGWRPFAAFGALAAAAVLTFLLWPSAPKTQPDAPPVVAQNDKAVPIAEPTTLPLPDRNTIAQPEFVEPPPALKLASATKLKVDKTAAERGGQVRIGQKLETEAGGQAFVVLPEGSKAGVLGNSSLKLSAASESDVKLELDRGTLLVAAAHVEQARRFAVQAGAVEIVVVGTRFLVERDDRVTVVVEEGKVEVAAGGQKHHVAAGETLIIETSGKVVRRKSVTPGARAAFRALATESPRTTAGINASLKANGTEARLTELEQNGAEEPQTVAMAQLPDAGAAKKFEDPTPPPLLVPGSGEEKVANGPARAEQHFDFLSALKKIDLKNVNLDSPFPPPGMPVAEYRVHQLRLAADRGQCERVVERSDAWLTEFGNDPKTKDLALLKKAVLFNKARCLSKLGRSDEAQKVRIQAESVR